MSDIVERLRGDYVAHSYVRDAADEIERLRAENELLAQRLKDSHDIVARIWALFGTPSYADLKGKSIYDLIADLQAENAKLREAALREALIHARNQMQHPDQLIDEALAGGPTNG